MHRPGLPDAEARVADAVLADPALVTSESVSDLAARAGSSTATVVRLSRRIGFDGFTRFKIALAEEAGMTKQFGHPETSSSDTTTTVLESSMLADARDLADAVTLIDQTQFDAAAQAIIDATDVLFAGLGTSAPLAQLGALWFLVAGIHASAVQDVQALDLNARLLRPGSACVLISHTGSSKDTVAIAKSARAAEARTIAITSFARSPLARSATSSCRPGTAATPAPSSSSPPVSSTSASSPRCTLPSWRSCRSEMDTSRAVADVAGRHLY